MSGSKTPNDIVLFHYRASPYGRRVTAYLALRNIPYAECLQPPILPRPDMEALGVQYRRSPVMAIGRDIYVDSRVIIATLEERFPASPAHPGLSRPETAGLAALLQKFMVDGSVFKKAVTQIPRHFPLLKDPKFRNDRAEFIEPDQRRNPHLVRPEGTVHLRQCFDIMESLLADGREWVGGTREMSLADLEGVWVLDWFLASLMPDPAYFSHQLYPRTYAWRSRYRAAVQAASTRAPKPVRLQGSPAVEAVINMDILDHGLEVDARDPLGLTKGDRVKLFPLDGGGSHQAGLSFSLDLPLSLPLSLSPSLSLSLPLSLSLRARSVTDAVSHTHQDEGRLIKLTKDEVAIAIAIPARSGVDIHVHAPRWAFRILPYREGARL